MHRGHRRTPRSPITVEVDLRHGECRRGGDYGNAVNVPMRLPNRYEVAVFRELWALSKPGTHPDAWWDRVVRFLSVRAPAGDAARLAAVEDIYARLLAWGSRGD